MQSQGVWKGMHWESEHDSMDHEMAQGAEDYTPP